MTPRRPKGTDSAAPQERTATEVRQMAASLCPSAEEIRFWRQAQGALCLGLRGQEAEIFDVTATATPAPSPEVTLS